MRAPFLMLPITLAFLAPLSGAAQDAPRMLFCSSQCFAVNANGDRTPAPKGTQLLAGQRLEVAPGGYAQVRLGGNAAVGVGEQASVRFEPNAVILDQGRIRVIGGEAFGKAAAQPIELRTSDGTLVLRGADVEMKKSGTGPTPARTLVKINAGNALLRGAQGDIAIPTEGVQSIAGGKVVVGAPIHISEIASPTRLSATAPTIRTPVPALSPPTVITRAPTTVPLPMLRPIVVPPPMLSGGERLLTGPVRNLDTGHVTSLGAAVRQQAIKPPSQNPAPISPLKTDSTVFQSKGTTFTRIGL